MVAVLMKVSFEMRQDFIVMSRNVIMNRNVVEKEKGILNSCSLEMLGDQTGNYKRVGEKMEIPKEG